MNTYIFLKIQFINSSLNIRECIIHHLGGYDRDKAVAPQLHKICTL